MGATEKKMGAREAAAARVETCEARVADAERVHEAMREELAKADAALAEAQVEADRARADYDKKPTDEGRRRVLEAPVEIGRLQRLRAPAAARCSAAVDSIAAARRALDDARRELEKAELEPRASLDAFVERIAPARATLTMAILTAIAAAKDLDDAVAAHDADVDAVRAHGIHLPKVDRLHLVTELLEHELDAGRAALLSPPHAADALREALAGSEHHASSSFVHALAPILELLARHARPSTSEHLELARRHLESIRGSRTHAEAQAALAASQPRFGSEAPRVAPRAAVPADLGTPARSGVVFGTGRVMR